LTCLIITAVAGAQPGPAGMEFLRVNAQGYDEYLWLKDSSVMIRIPAGTFTMGSNENDDEKPIHQPNVSEYYIDKFEVTNRQFKRFCDATGRNREPYWILWRRCGYPPDPGFSGMPNYLTGYPDCPVVNVSWNDAKAYCDWAGKSLPTEAQWEKAARGADGRTYPWGDSGPDGTRCNFADRRFADRYLADLKSTDQKTIDFMHRVSDTSCSDGYTWTAPVGSYPAGASPYGCMDMAGNVWEWCNDRCGKDYYSKSANNDPQGPASGDYRICRGGAWRVDARRLHSTYRHPGGLEDRVATLGFRTARGN
jgi:formylglycine-generating enzyme required for sulfatase activity